nr:MAG TPA: hypothetical protein [Caudoviricetes sp.]
MIYRFIDNLEDSRILNLYVSIIKLNKTFMEGY